MSSFTYSGNIQYLEHLVLTITLNVTGANEAIDNDRAVEILSEYYDEETVLNPNNFQHLAKRGDFEVTITSPSGTTSTLLFKRPFDIVNTEGYYNWPFLSVLHWGRTHKVNGLSLSTGLITMEEEL